MTRGLLLDLDDTLYEYAPAERAARGALVTLIAAETSVAPAAVADAWAAARDAVHARLGERGSAHSRLLYLSELAHALHLPGALASARRWERAYWSTFLAHARLREGARELLAWWRERGGRVAIVTDLTLDVQLWKLEHFGLLDAIDALATSEEVPWDKPAPDVLLLAIERLGVRRGDCVMVGDSARKDGGAASALEIPFVLVERGATDLYATRATLENAWMKTPEAELASLGTALGGFDFVQGPGGNVSVKTDRGELWVKASGTRLRDVASDTGHARVPLTEALAALDGDTDADAALFTRRPRPSLETYFHALPGRVVAHTHPVGAGLVACSDRALPVVQGVAVVDVPYRRPGRDLAVTMRELLPTGAAEVLYVLRNHGVVAIASTAERAIEITRVFDSHCRSLFRDLADFDRFVRAYLDAAPTGTEGDLTRTLPPIAPPHGDEPRYLFPDAVVYGSVSYASESPEGAKGTWLQVDPHGSRRLRARTAHELDMATEVIAAHDWMAQALERHGGARHLAPDEPAAILSLPSERYRMMVLGQRTESRA